MNIDIDKLLDSKHVTVSTKNKYKAAATVGYDTIEDVEYLVCAESYWWKSDKPKTFKDKLEKIWDTITIPYYVGLRCCKRLYWNIYYGFERMIKGYDSVDVFETYAKFTERYSKVLKRLRDNHMGYPCDMTEEEWDNVLDSMLYHLYYMQEDNVMEDLEKGVPEDWYPSQKNIDEIMEKHKDEFFKLFSKYFYNLWD